VSFARPYLYGLAAGGERGVNRALEIMEDAVRRDMALMGVRNVDEIDRSFLLDPNTQ
jgi:L-lactate dehydrogenase (cytochrome)